MDNEMTLGQWVLTIVLTCIPCVNVIMLLIWAFGDGAYEARKRFAQAYLIVMVVAFVLSFVLSLIFGASLAALFGSVASYY